MSKHFPHLNDTPFPHLDNADPYDIDMTFDYGRYDYEGTIKLMRVTWPSDYSHVVKWADAAARDAWFDAQAGSVVDIGNGFTHVQQESVRVPVPLDVALTYTYVVCHVPQLTEDEPIDYEASRGIRRVYAFIRDCVYLSPSTTELRLEIDYWTTYLPYKALQEVTLTRGHAPMYALDADTYLEAPLANCDLLGGADVGGGAAAEIVKSNDFLPLSTAELVIVIASTIPYGEIDGLVRAQSVTESGPTYYDEAGNLGYQVGVSDYQWAYGGRAYSGMTSPSHVTAPHETVPSGAFLYAVDSSDVFQGQLDVAAAALPVFFASALAAYVLPSNLIAKGTRHGIGTISFYEVIEQPWLHDVGTVTLTKKGFKYPALFADIAKLYTEQYAHVELSDDMGNVVTVRVEDTRDGTIDIGQQVSCVWPALSWDVMVTNVAHASGSSSYTWRALSGDARELSVPACDFAKYMLSYGIPTYALYVEASLESASTTWDSVEQERLDAIVSYKNAMQGANAAKVTADRSADTAKENADASATTDRSNAYDSAGVSKRNADRSAQTAKDNADRSADTAYTNTDNSCNTRTANLGITKSLRHNTTARQNLATSRTAGYAHQNAYDQSEADIDYSLYAVDVQAKSEAVAGAMNMVGQAAVGNLPGTISASVGTILSVTSKQALADLSDTANVAKQGATVDYIDDVATEQQNCAADISGTNTVPGYQDTAENDLTTNNNALDRANADNTRNTAKANAGYTRDAAKENAERSYYVVVGGSSSVGDTYTGNANRTYDTATGNATRTQGATKANALTSRTTSETINKRNLWNAQRRMVARFGSRSAEAPHSHGAYSGDMSYDALRRRGVHVRIVTADLATITRAGRAMLRYGYMTDGLRTNAFDLCPTGHDFCYWQAADVVTRFDEVANRRAFDVMRDMLYAGVTVWNDPAKVGRL